MSKEKKAPSKKEKKAPVKKEKKAPVKDEQSALERLVDVADAIFDRANNLDGIKLGKREDEAARTIAETRDDAFGGCIQVWRVIVALLPTSDMDQPQRAELEIDAYKVISRCHHRLGRLDAAQRSITKAIDLGYSEGFISLGAICLDMDRWEEAESAFKSALAKDVQSMRAHAGLGELYFKLGTQKLAQDPQHTEYFAKAEEEFIAAGKERFTEGFDRAMDLFETLGWRDRAMSIGLSAAKFYEEHRSSYGQKLRGLNRRIRKLAGEERHEKIVSGVGRKLGEVLGGKKKRS
jgi:tetratricopeptide (TPR) repeat protein